MRFSAIKNVFIYLLPIITLIGFLLTFISSAGAQELKLSTEIYHNSEEVFHSHQGPGEFDSTLAFSVVYKPVLDLRTQLETALNKKLDYFRDWNSDGEAHVTVITPLEFYHVLKSKLTMAEIEAIADKYDIQQARLMIMGIGSAKVWISGKEEETYFLIVDSYELRNIRQQIYYEFIRRGGENGAFDPAWFFPHITIGYTKRDLHEADGVLKGLRHSLDKRFRLLIR